jgi:hypothetical protein
MANLLYNNIGTNYKGILNLDATTINTPLDATLRAVTDGMGTSSLLQLSTAAVTMGSGTITSNGLLTVKGSGGNILSLRNASNTERFYIDSGGALVSQTYGIFGNSTVIGNASMIYEGSTTNGFLGYTSANNWSLGNVYFLSLGGTTSSFPAIKRNGAAIDFRLADDSGYAEINSSNVYTTGYYLNSTQGGLGQAFMKVYSDGFIFSAAVNINNSDFVIQRGTGHFGFGSNIYGVTNAGMNIDFATTLTGGRQILASGGLAYGMYSAYNLKAAANNDTMTGLFVNTIFNNLAYTGVTNNLMDLQVGGVSKLKVTNSGSIEIGNTVTSAAAIASTHKVTIVIGGVTYYLLASNV